MRKSWKSRRATTPNSSIIGWVMLLFVLLLAAIFLPHLMKDIERKTRDGIAFGGCAMLLSLGLLAYWYQAYRQRGIVSRPRISFREVYILYFGMSIEVGLIVNTIIGREDFGRDMCALLLPVCLIASIALLDDTPAERSFERRFPRPQKSLNEPAGNPPTITKSVSENIPA